MFLRYKELTDRDVYDFYRANRKSVSQFIQEYGKFVRITNLLFKGIKKHMIENVDGVCLSGFGYLSMVKLPFKRRTYFSKEKSLIRKFEKIDNYLPHFFPDDGLELWTMDDAFAEELRKKLAGKEFNSHPDLCKSMIIVKDYTKKLKSKNRAPITVEYDIHQRELRKVRK